jgi:hypothetical protein
MDASLGLAFGARLEQREAGARRGQKLAGDARLPRCPRACASLSDFSPSGPSGNNSLTASAIVNGSSSRQSFRSKRPSRDLLCRDMNPIRSIVDLLS